MIRINLLPTKKKVGLSGERRGAAEGWGSGQGWLLGMIGGWFLLLGAGYWLTATEEDAAVEVRRQAAAHNRAAESIKQDIDEEGLEASKQELAILEATKSKLEAKRRSPVYVMYELAMILTGTAAGGGPDIDEQKRRRQIAEDPQAEINQLWDPMGIWLTKLEQNEDTLTLEGGARDATDLSEFTRRLRVSARFGHVSHPNFERVSSKQNNGEPFLTWALDVDVRRWN